MSAFIDLSGKTFGHWTVISRGPNNVRGRTQWLCVCVCGTERLVVPGALCNGRSSSCGCIKLRDLTGETFHRWTVLRRASDDGTKWVCQCICGTVKTVTGSNLTSEKSKSCGCLKDELKNGHLRTHGMSSTREYKIWCKMRERCLNTNAVNFERYGGRGITICDTWQNSFEAFFADMGPCPSPNYSLERKRNNEGYSPDNCIWTTPYAQTRNKRNNVMLTHNDVTACLADWAITTGIERTTLIARLERGWSVTKTLMTPTRPMRPFHHKHAN